MFEHPQEEEPKEEESEEAEKKKGGDGAAINPRTGEVLTESEEADRKRRNEETDDWRENLKELSR